MVKRSQRSAGLSLSQALFSQGFGARREVEAMVCRGEVQVDGQVVLDPDAEVAPQGLRFTVAGREWPYRDRAVVLLNKPSGFECSLKPKHHPSLLSLLPPPLRVRGVQPVGRLDQDTTGLLLLTDDGELLHKLTSPKWHLPKVYRATCKHPGSPEAAQRLVDGVVLDDDPQPVAALAATWLEPTLLELTLGEGKYHQVKRMVAAVGNRVEALQRVSMGGLALDASLGEGQWRWLTEEEENALRALKKAAPSAAQN